ncbi:MAG TPA: hypothetical protein VFF06_21475 [Polyangia bacterium]|nr:hypothetical protein [Polyangia bacterium]
MPSPSAVRPRISLVALLAAVAFVELVLNRVIARLIHLEFLQPRSALTRVIDDFGLFAFELTSVLAVLLLGAALIRIVLYGGEFRAGARMSFPLVGAVFLALAAIGVVLKLPQAMQFHLHLSFLFLALLITLATVASHAQPPIKLGAVLLMAAVAMRIGPQLAARLGVLPSLTSAQTEAMSDAMLASTGAAALCFLPRRPGGAKLASLVTWPMVCVVAIIIRRDWETAARVAAYGFGVELPIATWGQLLCLAVLAAVAYSTIRMLSLDGVNRLRGYGFVLLAVGGWQLELPYQLGLAALGLLCIAESAVRVEGRPLARAAFEQLVKLGAAAVGAPSVTMTGASGYEVARLHSPPGGAPVSVTLQRRAGVVSDLEVTVGETPPRDPPFTISRRSSGGLGPPGSGARVETEDLAFDRAFEVHDLRGAGAPLLDDATRARMAQLVTGWLGVWPQRGLRYRSAELPTGDETLPTLIAFLRELQSRVA